MTRAAYATDLTDAQWQAIVRHLPPPQPRGRPSKYDRREIFNALLYLDRTGCQWRLLPHDFPPYRSVFGYFTQWKRDGTFARLHDVLVLKLRAETADRSWAGSGTQCGRAGQPVRQSRAVGGPPLPKRGAKATIGCDKHKQVNGRKRHLLVDTLGLVLAVVVHSAGMQDREGARLVLLRSWTKWTRLLWIWADGAYAGPLGRWTWERCGWYLGLVKRPAGVKGWQLLPHRWVVERTFAWLGRCRRLSKDYEFHPESSEAMVHLAMIHLMARRLTKRRPS